MAQFIINIVVLASIYAILGAGYVLIYRSSRVLNLAHGELMMLGGYFLFTTASFINVEGPVELAGALIASIIIGLSVGAALYYLLLRPMAGQPVFSAILVTVALSITLRGLATFIWTSDFHILTQSMGVGNPSIALGEAASVSTFDLIFVGFAVIYLTGLALFFRFARIGIQMRAASDNQLLASQRGINIYLIIALSWVMATLGASVAGILYGSNILLDPETGFVGLKAFAVPVTGGLYSLLGVIPGGIIIAAAETAMCQFWDPLMGGVAPMLVMLVVLIFKPWGIFGREEEIERV